MIIPISPLVPMKLLLASSLLFFVHPAGATASPDWRKASEEAEELIAKSRRLGGEEYAERARELLAPWWGAGELPGKIRLQRAMLLQRDHHFEKALADLNFLLKRNPELTEAWLIKTTILTVTGRFQEARQAAIPLFGLASPLVAVTAGTAPTSSNGNLSQSYQVLEKALETHPDEAAGIKAWAHTALAEMAVRLGKSPEAGSHFRSALRIDPHSPYLLKNYAGFLLEQGWDEKAGELIEPHREYFPVIWMQIRRAQGASRPELAELSSDYEASLVVQEARHGHSHGRDQAVCHLEIKDDPGEALHQAIGNWESQREASDLLILVKSARAADDQATLAATRRWIQKHQFEDVRLDALLGQSGPSWKN